MAAAQIPLTATDAVAMTMDQQADFSIGIPMSESF
jgi:hypothetical protein